jgi:pimeloyl-ACP methyl ester carboxylesterase
MGCSKGYYALSVRPGWTPVPMEDDMDQIEVKGLRIAFERAGEGPPLVLLHGAFGFDSRAWRRQLDGLSDEFTVVAWDMPGCGRSSDPPERFRISDYADCLAAFIDALGLGRPHLLGLSFGSGLALELYRWHPMLPRTLILASAYAGLAGSFPAEVVEQRLQHVLRALDLPPEQWAREWSPTMFTESAPAELVDEIAAFLSEFDPAGQRALFDAFAHEDLRDLLPRIDVPTLLLYGDKDVRSPLSVAEDLHARIPTSRLVVMPGVGHLSNVEAAERFNSEVRSFLREVER